LFAAASRRSRLVIGSWAVRERKCIGPKNNWITNVPFNNFKSVRRGKMLDTLPVFRRAGSEAKPLVPFVSLLCPVEATLHQCQIKSADHVSELTQRIGNATIFHFHQIFELIISYLHQSQVALSSLLHHIALSSTIHQHQRKPSSNPPPSTTLLLL
jgi:hypothetical protein